MNQNNADIAEAIKNETKACATLPTATVVVVPELAIHLADLTRAQQEALALLFDDDLMQDLQAVELHDEDFIELEKTR